MYSSIEVDFDVWKAITNLRKSPEMTENTVLRDLLGLTSQSKNLVGQRKDVAKPKLQPSAGVPWVWKGVEFPHGTEFRAQYKGRQYRARAENGALFYDGEAYKSPTRAAEAISDSPVNGWGFWECKLPGKNRWVAISELRGKPE